ncbi:hypothetical protein AR457_02065 [Streptomyces agglomeratus]|uniref:hypothetical protein n=1 Tax=Streptomyces agglomeratus TaxID=285458 RepID=UPI00086BBF7F|nr:hypothetical protein [Streptomyces agglomeratus]OEJ43064.1 hypothetical protein AR457_02065 [Streptomyces agglomeratus]
MAFRVTLEIYSGLPNPSWMVTDPDQVQRFLRLFLRHRAGLAVAPGGFTGVDFRGMKIDFASDTVQSFGLPPSIEIAGGGAVDPFASAELAEELLETMPEPAEEEERGDFRVLRDATRQAIQRSVKEGLGGTETIEPGEPPDQALAAEVEEQLRLIDQRLNACPFDAGPFEPAFWNNFYVVERNNCYNYAVNQRTDSFAQPGWAHGYRIPPSVTCADVRTGVLRDGLRVWGDCQPAGYERHLVALVTGTMMSGKRDYHWYRRHREGFWGHKLATNPAQNVDYSNNVITNPFSCNRGRYTDWCGFYQSHNSVIVSGPL